MSLRSLPPVRTALVHLACAAVFQAGAGVPLSAQDPSGTGPLAALGATARSFGFYRHGDLAPLPSERVFATRFEAARTQYVGVQIGFDVPALTAALDAPLTCTFTRTDGYEIGRFELRVTGAPGDTRVWGANANGYADPGIWPAGSYAAACREAERVVGEATFEVVDGPADLPGLDAKLTRIRFYESSADPVDPSAREYAVAFDAGTLRYLNVELSLRPGAGTVPEAVVPVACLFIRSSGAIHGSIRLEARAPVGDGPGLVARGFGGAEPGTWASGRYRVACTAEGRFLGDAAFIVR